MSRTTKEADQNSLHDLADDHLEVNMTRTSTIRGTLHRTELNFQNWRYEATALIENWPTPVRVKKRNRDIAPTDRLRFTKLMLGIGQAERVSLAVSVKRYRALFHGRLRNLK
jgi:hypothetical protein